MAVLPLTSSTKPLTPLAPDLIPSFTLDIPCLISDPEKASTPFMNSLLRRLAFIAVSAYVINRWIARLPTFLALLPTLEPYASVSEPPRVFCLIPSMVL